MLTNLLLLSCNPPTPSLQIGDLSRPQLRFKVEVNARENHLTGAVLLGDVFSVVVVEGGPKTLNR